LHGHADYQYPKDIEASDIISATSGKAQFIAISHSSGIKDGDVLTIGTDILRDDADQFEDFGVDIQVAAHIGQSVSVDGMIEILMMDQDGREIEHKGIIRPRTLQPGKDWVLVYDDEADGIAIYVDENVGIE